MNLNIHALRIFSPLFSLHFSVQHVTNDFESTRLLFLCNYCCYCCCSYPPTTEEEEEDDDDNDDGGGGGAAAADDDYGDDDGGSDDDVDDGVTISRIMMTRFA